jgi:hypothetical protein
MAAQDQLPVQEVAARAVEAYRRQRRLDQINADFAALRADPEAWQDYRSDLAAWDSTLLDGLDQVAAARSEVWLTERLVHRLDVVNPFTVGAVEDRLRVLLGL